jgi:hypothetical protein
MINIKVTPSFGKVSSAFKKIKLNSAIQEGIEKYAFEILGEAKKVTPVDTGRLRGSEKVDLFPLRAIVAPHTEYAVFVHEGTSRMRARPYMTWGMETARKRLTGLADPILNSINVEIKKTFKKL